MSGLPVIISCEHAGHQVPAAYQHLFASDPEVIYTHRGWDIGALPIARFLSFVLDVPLYYEETSRLLIEMNRSPDHPALFSSYSQALTNDQRQWLLQNIYQPYRQKVTAALAQIIQSGQSALHCSVHTFTPVLGNEVRTTDIGILFDPNRSSESKFADSVGAYLMNKLPDIQIDFNLPYAGTDDGFTTYLREVYPSENYCGIEIEVNQRYAGSSRLHHVKKSLTEAIQHFYR